MLFCILFILLLFIASIGVYFFYCVNLLLHFISYFLLEQKHLSNALSEKEELFSSAFQYAYTGKCIFDIEGLSIQINNSLCNMLGYSTKELLQKKISDFSHPEDWENDFKLFKEILTGDRKFYQIEKRLIHKNGHIIWTLLTVSVVWSEDGAPLYGISEVVDISDIKKVEETIRFTQFVIDNMKDSAFWANPNGTIVYANNIACVELGYTKEELIGMNTMDFIHGYSTIKWENRWNKLKENKTFMFESIHRKKNGELFPVEILGNYFLFEGQEYACAIVRNITERKLTEKLSQEREEKYRLLTENITDVIWVLNLTLAKFTYISPSVYKLRGYTVEEAMSQTVHESLTPESVEYVLNNIPIRLDKFLKEGSTTYIDQLQQPCKDGSIIWIETSTKYQFSKDNTVEVLGVSRNITERKKTESLLQEAIIAAEKANQEKTTFLASMSHDLRTPLNAIMGYAQILEKDNSMNQNQLNSIRTIYKSGEHLLNLINDILDLSKIEAGKLEIHSIPFNIENCIQIISNMIQIRSEQRGLQFSYNFKSDLPRIVYGDEKRLRQVLINLLENAVKFTDFGSVILHVFYQDNNFYFEVIDTGIGISKDRLSNLFKPFQQVHAVTRHIDGTGLGLSISKKLVEAMGGKLYVESVEGKGTKFWFHLEMKIVDLWLDTKQETKLDDIKLLIQKKHPKILVVDDMIENRDLLKEILLPIGCIVVEATNGKQAIEIVKQTKPDLILMDLFMPEMDGYIANREIKKLNEYAHIPIIAISADVPLEKQKAIIASGFDDFIPKPIDINDLLLHIVECLKLEWQENEIAKVEFPPPEELSLLLKYAEMSSYTLLQNWLQSNKNRTDTKYKIFIEKIEEHIKNFDFEEIVDYIKKQARF